MHPEVVDLADLGPRLEAMHDVWKRHLQALDDEAIARRYPPRG